ncbi:hypothetical protein SUDANB105_01556 [Streptomyces sp. enrichment culture]|uniref:hypothetical protein n=1 Tax=Streptomyces sp. enrichment culture TaxID=1795815 RepID=UPI003F556EA0
MTSPSPQSPPAGPQVTVRSAGVPAVPGVLVADDVVFVPHPPRGLVSAELLTAEIAPGTDGGAAAESLDVGGVRLLCLDDGRIRAVLAVLTLTKPSTLRRKVPQYTAARLEAAVAEHGGDLWAALGSLGYGVPAGARRDSDAESGPDLRAFTGLSGTPVEMYDSVGTFAESGCVWR